MVDRHDADDDAARKSMERRNNNDEAVVVVVIIMMVLAGDVSLMFYRLSSAAWIIFMVMVSLLGKNFCRTKNQVMGFSSPAKLSRKKDAISSAEGLLTNSHLQIAPSPFVREDNATYLRRW